MLTGIVFIGTIILLVVIVAGMYNGLVRLRNQVQNAWAQIDVQLKRRHELIPNLVETVKGYMEHEKETLQNVTEARTSARQATGVGAQSAAESKLSSSLMNLFAVAERYPDLKANQNFLALQEELTSTENKIAFSRQFYNDAVMGYNNKSQMFPSNIIANMFSFKDGEFFEVEAPAEREAPKVSF